MSGAIAPARGWLAGELVALALCWRLERRDGVMVALTDHDADLAVDGQVYRAAPGMLPSAIKRASGFDADTMQVEGALVSDAITEADLLAGRWDGARVVIFATDWSGGGGSVALGEGTLGAVSLGQDGFSAELAGAVGILDRAVVEATSPECRAELGDARCRVAMAARRRLARILAADGATMTLDTAGPEDGSYAFGRLRWLGGANAGLESAIAASAGPSVTLRAPPAYVPAVATLVEVVEGCDKSLATCTTRFANAVNFRGEPYLPGIDLLTRYPGA